MADIEEKEKKNTDIIYALADYKQLVIAYKTKYAELVKKLVFWKVSVLWLGIIAAFMIIVLMFLASENRRIQQYSSEEIQSLNGKLAILEEKLTTNQNRLETVQADLEKRESVIKELEKTISKTSKEYLEKLLIEEQK